MGKIIELPELKQLKADVQRLRDELAAQVLVRDELKYVICKNLETKYMLTLGALEYQVYAAYCRLLRLRRKVELIQAAKNRQAPVNSSQIEAELDREFEAYQQRLQEQLAAMNRAIAHDRLEFLTPEQNTQIKQLYRTIVKRLHPDLNPDLTLEQQRLFQHAVDAYAEGDVTTMQTIAALIDSDETLETLDSLPKLYRDQQRLEQLIECIAEEIAAIKTRFPYSMKPFIEDPELHQTRTHELNELLSTYQAAIERLEARIQEHMEDQA